MLEILILLFLIIFFLCGSLWSVVSESLFILFSTIVVSIAYLYFFMNIAVWTLVLANWPTILLGSTVFLIVGALYVVLFYWPRFVKEEIPRHLNNYPNTYKDVINTQDVDKFIKEAGITPSNNKQKIIINILLWPIASIQDLLVEPLKHILDFFYNGIHKILNRITQRIASKALAEYNAKTTK